MSNKTTYEAFRDLNEALHELLSEITKTLYIDRFINWLESKLDKEIK